jgi:hypothetical protein
VSALASRLSGMTCLRLPNKVSNSTRLKSKISHSASSSDLPPSSR